MTENGGAPDKPARRDLKAAIAGRKRATAVTSLRRMARAPVRVPGEPPQPPPADPAADEHCDICGLGVPDDHRHLLELEQRRIVCVCEGCWAMRSGDREFRPVGNRTLWLEDFDLPEDLWASFRIPIGLAFLMFSSVTECVVAMYPSPAGATESELRLETWNEVCELNPVLGNMERDAEALIVNRMADPPEYAIVPIDRAYMLVGLIKLHWEGISGGPGLEQAIAGFFADLRAAAVPA